MKKILSVLATISFFVTLTACNTISGAGKDLEKGGEHVQNAATNVQKKM